MEIEKPPIAMIVDSSVIKEMIEDNNSQKAVEVLKKLKEMDENPKMKEKLWIVTPTSSLLRAIYLAEPTKFNIKNLQRIVSCVTCLPSLADFRNEKAVMDELVIFAKNMSGEKKYVPFGTMDLGRQIIKEMIVEEVDRRIGSKENLAKQLIEYPRECILNFEVELQKIKELVEGFNTRLMQLEDICKVVNKVEEHMEAIELISERLLKLEEDFIMFKLKLLKEGKNEILLSNNKADNPTN